jgi:SPP1 gp7 family putative phage head morphogenesis protein
MPTTSYTSLPFAEANHFLAQKVNMPSGKWTEFTNGMHSRAFVVAGATKMELVADLHEAINTAISQGKSIGAFRKEFKDIVTRHGWEYKGKFGWRTSVIYGTNLSTAYAAGREAQYMDPDVKEAFPYMRYRTQDDSRVRPEHRSWNNVLLKEDDPWWETHTPPRGWRCRCWREPVSRDEYAQLSKSDVFKTTPVDNGTYQWTNPSTGVTETIPNGTDPGWNYDIRKTAWGQKYTKDLCDAAESDNWVKLDGMSPEQYGRGKVPVDKAVAAPYPQNARTVEEVRERLRESIGGDAVYYTNPAGEKVYINQGLVDHIADKPNQRLNGRDKFFPLLKEVVENPYEIWVGFERNYHSGKIRMRQRYVKIVDIEGTSLGLVCESLKGNWVGMTFFEGDPSNLKRLRVGRLLYGR